MDERPESLARFWWIVLLRGISAIVFGVAAAFAWPGLTLAVLVVMFGAFMLVDGVIGTIDAIRFREKLNNWWVWLVDGILGIVVAWIMHLWALAFSALFVVLAFRMRKIAG